MMRRGMLPIIMLPDGDLRIALHLVPFWILTIIIIIMILSTKFEIHPQSGLSGNVRKLLNQSKASKWPEFNWMWSKVNQIRGVP